MTPPDREPPILRGEWRLALAVAAVGTAVAMRRPPFLADVPSCPGLFDFAVVIALRTSGEATIGTVLSVFNIVLLFGGLLGLCRILEWASGSRFATIAVGLAAATSPAIVTAWSPTAAAATAACAACWLAGLETSRSRKHAHDSKSAPTFGTFAAAAATAPVLGVPLALAGGWMSWLTVRQQPRSRQWRAAGAMLGILLSSAVVLFFLHGTSATAATMCVMPPARSAGLTILSGIVETAPLPSAFAALGVWVSLMSSARAPLILLLALVASFSLFAGHAAGGLVPAALTLWSFCAVGLADVARALSGTAGRRAGAFALAIALVVLQFIQLRSMEGPADRHPQGHYALSRSTFLRLVETMPPGAVLVDEDAATALLGRTLPSRVRIRYALQSTPPDKASVTLRLAHSRVFALPRAQRRLQHLGFRMVAVNGPVSGLAEVLPGSECPAALTTEWRSFPELTESSQFTFTAGNSQSRGPLYLFAGSNERPDVRAVDWPPGTLQGFHPRSFRRADPADARVLGEELRTYGANQDNLAGPLEAPHVARIEMWRTSDAPLELGVGLGVRPNQVMARLADAAATQTVTLCPSFEHEIRAIVTGP